MYINHFLGRFDDISYKTDYRTERMKMYRARKKTQITGCRGIRSLDDLKKFLESKEGQKVLKHTDSDIELSFEIVMEGGQCNVILYDKELLKKLAPGTINHVDGTFGSRPNLLGCSQLLTVMSRKFDKVMASLIFFHKKRKFFILKVRFF